MGLGPAANEIHDLDLVALDDELGVVRGAFDDRAVALDGDAAWVDGQVREQRRDRQWCGQLVRVTVQPNLQRPKRTAATQPSQGAAERVTDRVGTTESR